MNTYIGTKVVSARPMSRREYNEYRGWELPADENGDDQGMLVEYLDGGKSNHPAHKGYISWSPLDVFERAYRPANVMKFGDAIEALKAGEKVARAGWNGKGMWLLYVRPYHNSKQSTFNPPFYEVIGGFKANGQAYELLPWIGMYTTGKQFVPWLASQTDMLAEDWQIVE